MATTEPGTAAEAAPVLPINEAANEEPPAPENQTDGGDRGGNPSSSWQAGMWKGVGIALGITGLLLIILVGASLYTAMSIIDSKGGADLAFIFSGLGLVNNTLLRLLAMLIGSGIIFGGLAVSFFSSSDENRVSLQAAPVAGEAFKAMVATHTPGIIGIFMGSVIIIAALFARSTHDYESPRTIEVESMGMNASQEQTQAPAAVLQTSSEIRKEKSSTPTKPTGE
jgi:hypothetical protein